MTIAQCPTCNTIITGEKDKIAICSNCKTKFKILIGTAKRRCDCGERLKFAFMKGGLFVYQCHRCGKSNNFF